MRRWAYTGFVSKSILLVEDHAPMAKELLRLLEEEGFVAHVAKSLAEARRELAGHAFHLAVLDVNLPDGTGFQLCRDIRERDAAFPVLFLTDRGDEDSIVKGLSFASTDYLRKPFVRGELLVRLRRLLKLGGGAVTLGDLYVDPGEKTVKWKGKPVSLSPREREILGLLAANVGRLVTRDRLATHLAEADIDERTINSYLSRLKTKLAAAGVTGIKIAAVYGEGYRLERE